MSRPSPGPAQIPFHPASRAVLAAACVAGVRAALMAARDGYLSAELWRMGLIGFARAFLGGLLWTLPVAMGLVALAWMLHRRQASAVWRALPALGALLLAVGFATFRLPADEFYAPRFETLRGGLATAGAAVAALLALGALSPRFRVPFDRVWASVALGLVLAAGGILVVHRGEDEPRWPTRPNLILISLDTLRADRVGAYGYERDTTPELDRFAERSIRFTNAFSHHPWTLTAHMTMLTSLYPSVHGVNRERGLPFEVRTLAATVRDEGYATLALVDKCGWLDKKYGFDRGFQIYRQLEDDAALKVDRVLWNLDNLGDQPFFLFAHFFDPHSDKRQIQYEADPELAEAWAGWYEGEFDGCEEGLGCASQFLIELNERGLELDEERLALLSDLYDAGIRTMDRELGRLFDELEARGLMENSVILVTADHGEEFGEHKKVLHSQHFDECLEVPFLLRTPDTNGGTSDELVGPVDVMPTLLDFLDLSPTGMQGHSLAPLARGGLPTETREYLLFDTGVRVMGLRTKRWSVLHHDGDWRLFDVQRDPEQLHDLRTLGKIPREAQSLIGIVKNESTRLSEMGEALAESRPSTTMTAEEEANLRALGYLEGEGAP